MTVRLFLTGKSLPNYVEAVFASRRLPPKAAVSAHGRHSFVEDIRNGGLDFLKTAAGICILSARKQPALQRFFSFPVGRGRVASYDFQISTFAFAWRYSSSTEARYRSRNAATTALSEVTKYPRRVFSITPCCCSS